MRSCLIQSAYNNPNDRMLLATVAHHAQYCRTHHISYWPHFGPLPGEKEPMWYRVNLMLSAIRVGYDFIIWMDADTLIVKPDQSLLMAGHEFDHVGCCKHLLPWKEQNWHYNCGVMFLKNTYASRFFLETVARTKQIPHPTWKVQATMLEINDRFDVIQPISDKWNSTLETNEHPHPVIKAWHGRPERLGKLVAELQSL